MSTSSTNSPTDKSRQEQYLCYDIKGIQQFIFSISKLRYVVGASLLIAQFDDEIRKWKESGQYETIFSGGGKGAIWCANKEEAEKLRDDLVDKAHEKGLDLRIGIDHDLSEAMCHADDLYPFVPDSLEGEPCSVSGLWPVPKGENEEGIHYIVAERRKAVMKENDRILDKKNDAEMKKKERILDNEVLVSIRDHLPENLIENKLVPEDSKENKLEFLTVVRAEQEQGETERTTASMADRSLGARNRWAVLSMDGNDMGCQFRAFMETNPSDDYKKKWLTEMSRRLAECTRTAFEKGLIQAITSWWEDVQKDNELQEAYKKAQRVVLPFRPLILGGDDILCLCHCSYALDMAETIIKEFNKSSKEAAESARKEKGIEQLWPGTGGQLTISAGIAYTGITLPLFLSIPYAEQLLGSAKGKYRDKKVEGGPTPSAIDWESLTETMVDTPAMRRKRDLTFYDSDLGKEICLTMRPYQVLLDSEQSDRPTLNHVKKLQKDLRNLPRSVRTELMTVLKLPWGERTARLVAMAVREKRIFEWLDDNILEQNSLGSCWQKDENGKLYNWFLDALLLLEEDERMEKETI